MRRDVVLAVVVLVVLSIASHFFWNHLKYVDYLQEIVHETDRWAVIKDGNGHHLAVEPTSDEVWNQIVELRQNGTEMWIGGVVEDYRNKWGFPFQT